MDAMEYSCRSIFATLPKTTRGLPMVLGGDPKGKNFLYCNGHSVIIRDIDNPAICDVYTEHSQPTTVAKYSPSGFYIASGDQSGKLRIWDTTQKEHILKKEYQPIGGLVRDIAWSPDSQRIAVVGEGREKYGHVFLMDTGTSNGSLTGQSKNMTSVEFRPERPFRIVSASEDNTVAFFEGPPFKFKNSFQHHTRFANCVRYQPPSGALFASCGADGKIFLYEGTEGDAQGELVDNACKGSAHSGGVYGLSWSPDGGRLLSVSGDKTCKLWDVPTRALISSFTMGGAVEDQQLGCLWQGPHLLSVSLSGFINYLDPNDPARPIRVVKGHSKPVTSVTAPEDGSSIFTGDSEGNVTRWDSGSGETERLEPRVHKSQVQGLRLVGDRLVSAGMDDTVACTGSVLKPEIGAVRPEAVKLSSQPRGLAVSRDGALTAVGCQKELCLYKGANKVASTPLGYEPTSVSIHPNKHLVAVGGEDNKVHVYEIGAGEALSGKKELPHTGLVTAVEFSPDGTILAACDAARKVVPYRTDTYESAAEKDWSFHTARVNCLSWCPDGRHLATGSLDTSIIVWDLLRSGEHPLIIKGAHTMSQITGLTWLSPNCLVSVGQDSNVKQWTINL